MKLLQNKNNVTELKNIVNKMYYIHYDCQFLGTVAARTRPEAFQKALNKYGRHIIKNTNHLDVSDSGKYENR